MAIMGMDQYGYLLSDLIPASLVVRSVEDAQSAAEERRVPVLLPFGLARQVDSLPHSWVVTSDSIAAWVGSVVSARLLMLLKDSKAFSSPIAGEDNSSPRAVSYTHLTL